MKRLIICALVLLFASAASAETAFQFTTIAVRAPDDPDVNGMRFSLLHGKNQNMRGFDFGLISLSESTTLSGLAMVFGLNRLNGNMDGGAAISLINVHTGSDRGLNAAFVNRVNEAPSAVDLGFVNIADGETMADVGGLNVSDSSTVQLGFLNVTRKIKGAQIGFLNIAENGFLPVFPIFNFPVD
jgi:hypothetical protein